MSRSNVLGISWPPRGWEQLDFVKEPNMQVVAKNPSLGTIEGISYQIDTVPVSKSSNAQSVLYYLSIDGWKYSIQNKSCEYNILSFNFLEYLDSSLPGDSFIFDIKIKSRSLVLNTRSAERACSAATFIIKQIVSGRVLDYNRILRFYKIHPSQHSIYELACTEDSVLKNNNILPCCADNVE